MSAALDDPWRYSEPAPTTRPPATSWRPVDLADVISADSPPVVPTIGWRSDGQGILYPGRTHSMSGESEAKKSWIAKYLCIQVLGRGLAALFLDFEDAAYGVGTSMLRLGAPLEWLIDRFAYISPSEPITSGRSRTELDDALRALRPALVIVDGVTEALAMHGFSTVDNDDMAKFGRLVTRPLAESGAAVLSLDHVTKDSETRSRYALGAVHKLNGLTGAAFTVENITRSGEGLAGKSRILIAKDRPGQLRPHALPGAGDRWWFADFTLDTGQPDPAELLAPVQHTEPFQPTTLMAKVSAAMSAAPGPLSTNDITARVKGRRSDIASAVAALVDRGHIELTTGPRGARQHTLVKPYPPVSSEEE